MNFLQKEEVWLFNCATLRITATISARQLASAPELTQLLASYLEPYRVRKPVLACGKQGRFAMLWI